MTIDWQIVAFTAFTLACCAALLRYGFRETEQ